MRGSDSGPWRRLPSLTAFWIGLLYDDDALNAVWDLVKDWSAAERQKLRDDVPKLGFKAVIRDTNLLELARETLALSDAGLRRRNKRNAKGEDESSFLRPLDEFVERGITPAEELLDKYNTVWNRSVEPIYNEYAY
jgi:glutamate--cysteine ligase